MKKTLLLLATCLFFVLTANAESWKTIYFEDFGDVKDWPSEKNYQDLFFYEEVPEYSKYWCNYSRTWNSFPLGRSKDEKCGALAHIKTPMDYYAWPEGNRKPCDSYGTYMPKYVIGGDHTYPSDPRKGCFVYVQLPLPSGQNEVRGLLFHKTFDISNIERATIRTSAWIANFSTTKDVDVWITHLYYRKSYSSNESFFDTGITSQSLKMSCAKDIVPKITNVRTFSWDCATFTRDMGSNGKRNDKLEVWIEYRTKKECYWGIGIDDIKLEFDQSTAIAGFKLDKTVNGRNVSIKPDITVKRLEEIMGTNNGYYYYEWYHQEKGVDKKIGGGRLSSDYDLQMNIPYYDPKTHNGRWTLKIWNNKTTIERYIDMNLKESDLVRTRGIGFDDNEEDDNYDDVQEPKIYNDGINLYINDAPENSQFIVYDMSGKAVAYSTTSPVNISVLKKGLYVVDVNGTKIKFMKK